MGHESGRCETCNRSLKGRRSDAKFCSDRCRRFAFDNRKRMEKRLKIFSFTPDENADVLLLAKVSRPAADAVARVVALAGRDLGNEVLDGMWDLLVQLPGFVEMGVRNEARR